MADAGAEIIDPVDPGDPFTWFDAEFIVLLNEFKGDIAAYLSKLRHTSMRTLADLIRFNIQHCEQEMRFFGQEIFEISQTFSRRPRRPGLPGGTRTLSGAGPRSGHRPGARGRSIWTRSSRRPTRSARRVPPSPATRSCRCLLDLRRRVVPRAFGCRAGSFRSRSSSRSDTRSSSCWTRERGRGSSARSAGRPARRRDLREPRGRRIKEQDTEICATSCSADAQRIEGTGAPLPSSTRARTRAEVLVDERSYGGSGDACACVA